MSDIYVRPTKTAPLRLRQTLIHQSGLALKGMCFSSLSSAAKPSGTSSGYAFMRAFSGSNIAERAATLTGKRSFMYCTCSLLPGAAWSIGR